MIKRIIIFIAIALCLSSAAFAKDIAFEVTADRNRVSLGQPVVIYCTFSGTQDIPSFDLKTIEGFQARYVGPSTRMSFVNGKVSSSITHIYSLLSLKVGTFTIGPITFTYNNDTYKSNSLNVSVLEGDVTQQQSLQQPQVQPQDLKDRIFLVMNSPKDKAYINEVIPVRVKLYVNKLGVRDIQFPEFAHEGFSVKSFAQPKQYQETVESMTYDVIEFDTSVFGTRSGLLKLGPANLQCNLILKKEPNRSRQVGFDDFFGNDIFDDFFGRYQSYPLTVHSAEIPVTIQELPQENKPAEYHGAIGSFDMDVSVTPAEVVVGDPITIKVTVKGDGNMDTVTMPVFDAGTNFKVYEPQTKQENGVKTFEEIVMPLSSDIHQIPVLRFSYFDPATGLYETKTKGPFPIRVTKPAQPEEQKIVEATRIIQPAQEKLGRDIVFIKESAGRIERYQQPVTSGMALWVIFLIPPFGLLLMLVFRQYLLKIKTDTRYARQLYAPKKAAQGIKKAHQALRSGNKSEFFDVIFSTLQEYWGDRFHLPSQGITLSVVEDTLRDKPVAEDIIADVRDIFGACDMARYASAELSSADMNVCIKKLEKVIAYFQKNKV